MLTYTEVEVVQFLRPDGRRHLCTTTLNYDLHAEYAAMQIQGWRFEAEVLTTGEVSLTITSEDQDEVITIVPNGPTVPEALARMLSYEFGSREAPTC